MTSQSLSSWLSIKSDDIDCGLAADFDGSLSGLGVELGSSTYNMSEALLALPVFKQESLEAGLVSSRPGNQDSVPGNQGNQTAPLGAPGSTSTTWVYSSPHHPSRCPPSQDDGENACHSQDLSNDSQAQDVSGFSLELLRGALVASSETDDRDGQGQNGYQLGQQGSPPSSSFAAFHETDLHRSVRAGVPDNTRFQYILNAPTSPATKLNEETLTYLNQGQSYEIKLKKFGESLENTTVKSIIRVVFHDRRLQYAELEQLQLWRLGRPGERLLDLDVPLSTGIFDVVVESNRLNSVAFKWDPNKECIVFVKVHCISTEFTPKKHGGEKGVPFRVQIETYDEDNDNLRIMHCASCQVKVFKPKGADRKQKTDRDKMEKRLGAEKDKYQPSYEVTVLTELPLDQAQSYLQQLAQQERLQPEYKKASGEVQQWTQPAATSATTTTPATVDTTESNRTTSRVVSFNLPEPYSPASSVDSLPFTPVSLPVSPIKPAAAKSSRLKEESTESLPAVSTDQVEPLCSNATSTEVTKWLLRHRFSSYSKVFQNFAGADLLRLTRDDLIQICGLVDGIRLNNALQSKSVRPKLTIYVSQNDGKSKKTSPQASTSGSNSTSEKSTSPTPSATSPSETTHRPHPGPRLTPSSSATTLTSSKRQYREAEEEEPEEHAASSSKKQRTRTLRMSQAEVYHALYLDTCTVEALKEKIAGLFMIEPHQIIEAFMAGPSGINILITDDVVQNFIDQSRFHVEAEQDEDCTTKYRLLMKILQ